MFELTKKQRSLLRSLARTYVWWKTPEEALRYPRMIVAQVLNMGDWDDVLLVLEAFEHSTLRDVLREAEAGQFDERSWHFWHYRLGLAKVGQVPPLPERAFA